MANSGIYHVVATAPVPRSKYEDQDHHALSSGTAFPASPVEKQLFYRTDLHKLYIHNGSGWVDTSLGTDFTAHASRHLSGGADSIKIDDLAAPDDNTDLNASTAKHGLMPKLDNVATNFINGVGAWANPILAAKCCYLQKTGAQTITNITHTLLTWDYEYLDTDTMHDPVTNPDRVTIKTAGKYIVLSVVQFASNAVGLRYNILAPGGSLTGILAFTPLNGDMTICQNIAFYDFAVNDYISVDVYQSSGGNLDVGNTYSYFAAIRMGA